MVIIADRMAKVRYPIRDVVAAAKKLEAAPGPKMLNLSIGDPDAYDFDTPAYVKKALYAAVEKGFNGYADSSGYLDLRKAVCQDNSKKGIDCTAEQVIVTTGTSEATNMLYGAMLNPGDEVLVPAPCYPQYENLAYYYGAKPVFYPLDEQNEFHPHFEELEKLVTKKTKMIVSINPNNPTGAVMGGKETKKFVEFAAENDLVMVSDEIYDQMVFGEKIVSAASLSKEAPIITLNGISKNYLSPGWRVGWMSFSNFKDSALPAAVTQLCRLRLSAPLPMQVAAVEALQNEKEYAVEKKKMLEKLRKRRDLAHKRLNELPGVSCVLPKGAFYAFPQLHDEKANGGKGVWQDDKQFVYELLEKERVLTVFGSGFGESAGSKHFRIVFLPTESELNEAFDRIGKFLKAKGF